MLLEFFTYLTLLSALHSAASHSKSMLKSRGMEAEAPCGEPSCKAGRCPKSKCCNYFPGIVLAGEAACVFSVASAELEFKGRLAVWAEGLGEELPGRNTGKNVARAVPDSSSGCCTTWGQASAPQTVAFLPVSQVLQDCMRQLQKRSINADVCKGLLFTVFVQQVIGLM